MAHKISIGNSSSCLLIKLILTLLVQEINQEMFLNLEIEVLKIHHNS